MRTFKIIISPTKNKKNAAFCQYFKTNTADSKCMYNTANFYIRNTMTGLKNLRRSVHHWKLKCCITSLPVFRKLMRLLAKKI